MRRSREETAETRRRILDTASRLFRARGIASVSIADVMSELDMTVGGFYRHFESKEALVAEAIDVSSAASVRRTGAMVSSDRPVLERITDLLNYYLSTGHKDNPGFGCPVPALASEIAHEGLATKAAFTTAIERLLQIASYVLPGDSAAARDERLRMASSMVGAMVLARATSNQELAEDLLAAVRRGLIADVENREAKPAGTKPPRARKRSGNEH